uniref:HAP1 N-terminal domain-containing protein n=1 Tax=Gorilla gorilla gorilla TaxID=9595 RepID=G3RAK0_GORGO
MRPKRLGQCCAGSRLGPGDPAALTCAPSPSASPAPEPSAQPQARGTGQRAGSRAASGSQFLSEARTGARPASEAGAKAGARRPSAFSAIQGDVRSMPDNSDAPWTRFVFQGPFGSRATGRRTGKAAGIWKMPAAYVGRRPGVSGLERAAFIRELEEAEASQQMAELSEVLVLRLENYERQQQEVARLQARVLKLQQRCRTYGAETEKLQKQLASEKEIQMQLQEESLWVGSQLQDLREKYMDCGGMLIETQEEVKTLHQQPPVSTGSATHYPYSVPLETLPGFQETLAEERRTSLRRRISDPVYFMERNYEMPRGDTSSLRYDFRYSEDREQVQGFEAEEGLMLAADIMRGEDFTPAEELVPEEELGAAKKVPAEEGVMEEAELVSEETEGWEEVELELDEAARMNVVTSALEASGLGPSHLDMNYVLQQLANWQDAHYRRQLRWKMLQKGECPHGALPAASRTSCRSSCR